MKNTLQEKAQLSLDLKDGAEPALEGHTVIEDKPGSGAEPALGEQAEREQKVLNKDPNMLHFLRTTSSGSLAKESIQI